MRLLRRNGMPTTELRQDRRVDLNGTIIIHDNTNLHTARFNNLGEGGLFLESILDFAAEQCVRLVIKSPRLLNPIQAEGCIVRVERSHRTGTVVRFTALAPASRQLLFGLLEGEPLPKRLPFVGKQLWRKIQTQWRGLVSGLMASRNGSRRRRAIDLKLLPVLGAIFKWRR